MEEFHRVSHTRRRLLTADSTIATSSQAIHLYMMPRAHKPPLSPAVATKNAAQEMQHMVGVCMVVEVVKDKKEATPEAVSAKYVTDDETV
ncbi:hypothetical protein EJB05_31051, partial [Eragrostis curvula]